MGAHVSESTWLGFVADLHGWFGLHGALHEEQQTDADLSAPQQSRVCSSTQPPVQLFWAKHAMPPVVQPAQLLVDGVLITHSPVGWARADPGRTARTMAPPTS